MRSKDFPPESQHTDTDPLELFGVPEGASHEEIRKAYRLIANRHHPDKENVHPDLSMNEEDFIAASLAYATHLAGQSVQNAPQPPPYPDSLNVDTYAAKVDLAPGTHVFETSSRYPRNIRI